ncbi:hypothetical protein MG290_05790 [Flavobacterium sp. CBA20B-1]|uniref:hypothetical protein n=1 Tax=unclassified Flavobacterium TaxID=196869 RepID=UPI0022249BB9|nr:MULTISPECIES: hypothetical protein [unclassified Flavobacterium]WCM43170.1 hypothetical protein MG290_05790 [Flavobacterium sp. CBA20B-1]
MLHIPIKRFNVLGFCLFAAAGATLTSCSSLSQQPYDVDGIYNNSKIVVEDTHEKGKYYAEYFKEKTEDNEAFFTDVDNYSSNYNQPNGGWGDATTDTQIVYNFDNWGWGNPYWGWNNWGWGSPFWGWNNWGFGWGMGMGFGWGGAWGWNNWGWGNPYWGWGYPGVGFRNISRSNSYRALTSRQWAYNNRMATTNARGLRSSSLSNRNSFGRSTTFARENSRATRMAVSQERFQSNRNSFDRSRNTNNNFNTRTNRSNRIETNRMQRSTRPVYTPSSNSRMNSGGSFGGSRGGGSMGGGMRSGGGRR